MVPTRKPLPLASNIRFLRTRLAISQAALGSHVGLSRSNIASYESGKAEPRAAKLAELASFLQVSLEDLITVELSARPTPPRPTAEAAPTDPAPRPTPPLDPGGALRGLQQRNARIRGALTRLEFLSGAIAQPDVSIDLNLIAINFERMAEVVQDLVRNDEALATELRRGARR